MAAQLVRASNEILRKNFAVWDAHGRVPPSSSDAVRLVGLRELKSASNEGKERRKLLKEKLVDMQHEYHGLGTEMNQLYAGRAVYVPDEPKAYEPQGKEAQDSGLYHEPNTYPGRRLPHVWLNTSTLGPLVSSLDMAGKGYFTLFIGIGGEKWKEAAEAVQKELKIEFKVVGIGRGLEWEDAYLDWED